MCTGSELQSCRWGCGNTEHWHNLRHTLWKSFLNYGYLYKNDFRNWLTNNFKHLQNVLSEQCQFISQSTWMMSSKIHFEYIAIKIVTLCKCANTPFNANLHYLMKFQPYCSFDIIMRNIYLWYFSDSISWFELITKYLMCIWN